MVISLMIKLKGWSAFHRLLISLFKFLAPFIRTADLQNASRNLFRGAQRLLLVLHDFPEFLAEYYFTICDVIPPRCIQLRNVILSAYPPKLVLPDPHLVDMRAEMGPVPSVLSDVTIALGDGDLRTNLDLYLIGRGSPSFPGSLKEQLLLPVPPSDPMADRYSLSLINALTLYVGVSSVAQAKARTGTTVFTPNDLGAALFLRLATDLDTEGNNTFISVCGVH
jgi:CCR4-NOT transcription complex subunit 1